MKKILFILLMILTVTSCKKEEKNKIESFVPNFYTKPIISEVIDNDGKIEIISGNYNYGDINFDNEINELDIEIYDMLLSGDFVVMDNQLKLADLDKDNQLTENDKLILKKYLETNQKYNTSNDPLEYCVTMYDDSNTCNWSSENTYEINDQDYYIFVRNKKSLELSDVYYYQHIVKQVSFFTSDDR